MNHYVPRPLREGQRVRLSPEGPVLVVERVSPGAAYVRSQRTRHVVIQAKFDGEGREMRPAREFDGAEGGLLAISRNAFVYDASEAEACQ